MMNPYQSPREQNAERATATEQPSRRQKQQPGYIVAFWFFATSVALVITVAIVFRLPFPRRDLAAVGIVVIHSTIWAVFGLLQYGRLGFFALGISAFAAFLVLAAAAQILWMSMGWHW